MVQPLTIRNLTSTPLELKRIERYPSPSSNDYSWFSRNATSTNSTEPSASELAERAQSFAHNDISLLIKPFQTQKTSIEALSLGPTDVLRLTFESAGQRYRIDTPSSNNASQTFTPLAPNPKHQYTGIYHPLESHLAIFSSANLQCWMRELSDETPISGLSIPGTHNTPTCYRALPSVRCQAVSPLTQLENGIRFFDIRVQPSTDTTNPTLTLVHGVFPISLTGAKTLSPLLTTISTFLTTHPSETVILSLKREGPGSATDAHLSTILHTHYISPNPHLWYTSPLIPTLRQARGKIILLRRFALAADLKQLNDGHGWALDAENWAYNTPDCIHGAVRVQDYCDILSPSLIPAKLEYCAQHFERAARNVAPLPGVTTDRTNPVPPEPLYLNFLTGSNFFHKGCWPEKVAGALNPGMIRYLCLEHHGGAGGGEGDVGVGDGSTGVVVCDWVGEGGDWDLVRCVVGMNAFLEMREGILLEDGGK
ncbi:phosphatidylinositol phospholipase C [Saccharata proteae CBS 121410]|uniref:Phosphatidylinositol phospholipase C n=1 Tax=Saccharata proteae CBS 121410 TaxID=1314787 RepID=A0A6A5YBA7_9PEZI|nr:phosphatidylinositol phospholipase C [Saccharata proteae CBS 121410]